MSHSWTCANCNDRDCDGCDPSDWLPEGGETMDARDATPPPPALLDPESVLRNRERVRKLLATGEFTWPRAEAA